jgi:integrase
MDDEQRKQLHKMILEFGMYAAVNIPKQIANVRTINNSFPKDIKNETVCYLLNSSLRGILESLLNDLAQAADLMNKAIKDFGDEKGLKQTGEIADVLRMRNKLLAHRFEVLLSTDKHESWYNEKYGSYEKSIALVETAARHLGEFAAEIAKHEKFGRPQGRMSEPPVLKEDDIKRLLEALKKAEIY